MRLSPWLPILVLLVAGAAVGYAVGLRAVPYRMMAIQMERFERITGGPNRMMVGPPGKNLKRPIEKANPDIQAANCSYDLAKGPVRLKGPVWDGYWSLSFFQANSDNFAILTDRDTEGSFDVVLATDGQATPPGVRVVRSPSARGIAMIRMFVGTEDDKRRAHAAALASTCAPA